jgi:MYXO-CTERM domain-containing protein
MRLVTLLALLALPALAGAQAVGVVEPQRVDDRYATDLYVNLAECDPAQAIQREFRWNVQLEAGQAFRSGVFRFFASNKQPTADTSGGLAYCDTEDDASTNLKAGQVGEDITTSAGATSGNGTIPMQEIASESGRSQEGQACTVGGDLIIYICVHYHPYTSGTAVDPTPRGLASGTLTLSTQAPQAPRLDRVSPGNERLEADWTAATGGIAPEWFRVIARQSGSTAVTSTRDSQGSNGFVSGLVNGTTYDVTVAALSAAGNPSPESNALPGTPIPADDFWDRYSAAGGQEQGGCASGAAGPLALLGLAALLARRRNGRRS